jgi:hypothetical protein
LINHFFGVHIASIPDRANGPASRSSLREKDARGVYCQG